DLHSCPTRRSSDLQARRVQAALHAHPQRARLDHPEGPDMNAATKFYGKYRGTLLNNVDPMMIGRVQVQCAEVLVVGISSWAMPCVPVAGKHSGAFFVPEIGAGVW